MSIGSDSSTLSAIDPATLRKVYGHFPSGLVTVAALGDDGPVGLIVSTFTPVSLYPPLVAVNIAHTSSTLPILQRTTHWGISILGDHQIGVAEAFRRPAAERFGTLGWTATDDGAVHLDGAPATLTVRPIRFVTAGDHVIAIGEVDSYALAAGTEASTAPLIFHHSRLHGLDKEIVP